MNGKQLRALGVPEACLREAMTAVRLLVESDGLRKKRIKELIKAVLEDPAAYSEHAQLGTLAAELIEDAAEPDWNDVSYRTWGDDIDEGAHAQMRNACRIPSAVGAAMMPDAHIGYGLPIGGVLATENTVIPYAVGVDIACRMKLSILDTPVDRLSRQFEQFRHALEKGTRFGVGSEHETPQDHAVMDEDWSITRITRERKDKAWKQLGTSGSGNHFAEFGVVTLSERQEEFDLEPGEYVAILSHSGSRGAGAAVCSTYSGIARSRLPKKFQELQHLAWLDLDSAEGQEYWDAMNLMGRYASANHDVIHRLVSSIVGGRVIAGVENHHNFAWREEHQGREVIVHRKGATPAAAGEIGVIPGSMATPTYVVRGRGHAESLNSSSHGAGRAMSRKKAKEKYRFNAVRNDLEKRGIRVLSAGADEVPGVYKDIDSVMRAQTDLVETIARFDPKIVRMCGDGSRAED